MFATSDNRLKPQGNLVFRAALRSRGRHRNRMHGKFGQRAADTGEIFRQSRGIPLRRAGRNEGEGFEYAMNTFKRGRPEIGAIAIGVSQRALDECLKYSRQRSAFGQPIASFQALQFMMADMVVAIEAMRLLTCKAAWSVDNGASAKRDLQLRQGFPFRCLHQNHH